MGTKRTSKRGNSKRIASVHQTPGIEPLIPEIRSDIKWKPTQGVPAPFAIPAVPSSIIAVWNFGVPFKEMDKFHKFLRANEMSLAGQLKSAVDAHGRAEKVVYLGTYLNIDSGTPMYQTYWGYTSEAGLDDETAWPNPLPPSLRSLIVELRGYWARDPGRSETRFGLASNYADLATMSNNSVMLGITLDATRP